MLRAGFKGISQNVGRRWASTPVLPPVAHTPAPYNGPSYEECKAKRARFLYPSIMTNFKTPVMLVEGNMQYLYDETGKRYLDMLAGVATVQIGHSHPKVIDKMKQQSEKLIHAASLFYVPDAALFAEELHEMLPPAYDGDEWVFFFTNSGAEATDRALLLARAYTGEHTMIGLRTGYHGLTEAARSACALGAWKNPAIPPAFPFQHARFPSVYRGPFGDGADIGPKYAEDVNDLIMTSGGGKIAGFIAEPITGVGGFQVLPKDYLNECYKYVRAAGGVCIADEVQVGYGRTGKHFWGWRSVTEGQGSDPITPDIITMAKGIGNGFPLGAVAVRRTVAKSLEGTLYYNTYGGNPLQMVTARTVLEVMKEEKLQQNALERGEQFLAGLRRLQDKHECIGHVRGMGLLTAFELVKDRQTKEPMGSETLDIMTKMKDLGVISGRGGPFLNVIRFAPPLCVTKEDIDFTVDVIDAAISAVV